MKLLTIQGLANARDPYLICFTYPTKPRDTDKVEMTKWGGCHQSTYNRHDVTVSNSDGMITFRRRDKEDAELITLDEDRGQVRVWVVYEMEEYFTEGLKKLKENVPQYAITMIKNYLERQMAMYSSALDSLK